MVGDRRPQTHATHRATADHVPRATPLQAIAADLEMVYTYFPRLRERRKSQAGYTSGTVIEHNDVGNLTYGAITVSLSDLSAPIACPDSHACFVACFGLHDH